MTNEQGLGTATEPSTEEPDEQDFQTGDEEEETKSESTFPADGDYPKVTTEPTPWPPT
jgi:hypothetical protein